MPKLVCLLSGGIDSPVAAYLMIEKGFDVVFLHLYTSDDRSSLKTVKRLVKKLSKKTGKKLKLYVGDQTQNQKIFKSRCETRLMCVLCKRMMYRMAEAFAKKVKARGILTGENLGQVASQTLKNLSTLNKSAKLPIIRPLIGMEKNDIIRIARGISTFEISISFKERCEFVPRKPETGAGEAEVDVEESTLNIGSMIKNSIDSIEEVKL